MLAFETILVMLAAAVLLLGVARRWRLPYPVLLALTGVVVAIAPIDVSLHLDPALVLTLFVAPTLLDAAYDTSLRDLKRQWAPVMSLALIAVGLTTEAVDPKVHDSDGPSPARCAEPCRFQRRPALAVLSIPTPAFRCSWMACSTAGLIVGRPSGLPLLVGAPANSCICGRQHLIA